MGNKAIMKKFSAKYLLLTAILAVSFTASIYFGSWPSNYESWTAAKKMDYLWTNLNKDHSMGSFPDLLGKAQLALPEWIGGLSLWVPGQTYSDQVPEGRPKAIHSVGVVGKVKFNFDQAVVKKLGLTGAWTESVDLIARALQELNHLMTPPSPILYLST